MESSENNFSRLSSHSHMIELADGHSFKQTHLLREGKTEERFSLRVDHRSTMIELQKRITALEQKLLKIETKRIEVPKQQKKRRRKAKEVPRLFQCNFGNCQKQYGSEASLRNHKKIKHGLRLFRKTKQKVPINLQSSLIPRKTQEHT